MTEALPAGIPVHASNKISSTFSRPTSIGEGASGGV
jgi:hypothetical protein